MASLECPPHGNPSAHNSSSEQTSSSSEHSSPMNATGAKSLSEAKAYLTDIRTGDNSFYFLIECGPQVELSLEMGLR